MGEVEQIREKKKNEPVIEPDQSKFNLGIRDLPGQNDSEDGKFNEQNEAVQHDRRDPEESRHNEAGQKIPTQSDYDEKKLN
jgi:hypothetical protein